ncbi:UNVERIFIED_ORG: hypothetical protein ABRZ91_001184 [Heyndrickxia coagulans]
MTFKTFDSKALDAILEKMIGTVEESKHEIFEIGERCRQDYDALINELEEVKATVVKVIEQTDELETKSKFARRRLAEYVSSFSRQGLNIGYSKTLFLYTFGYRALLARCNFRKRCNISV